MSSPRSSRPGRPWAERVLAAVATRALEWLSAGAMTRGDWHAAEHALEALRAWSCANACRQPGLAVAADGTAAVPYSAAAIAKQDEVDRLTEQGLPVPFTLLAGIAEPAVPAQPHERCRGCGADARTGSFGGGDGRWCGLCLDRGRDKA